VSRARTRSTGAPDHSGAPGPQPGGDGDRRDFRARVEAVVATLKPGEVVSYGDVAEEAGFPGAARAVGMVMATPGPGRELPWWRVVTSTGRLVPGLEARHARLLRSEGVALRDGKVAMPPRRAGRLRR
jgi:methylated-DNA-protein-cysteine methyltransferase related protein